MVVVDGVVGGVVVVDGVVDGVVVFDVESEVR